MKCRHCLFPLEQVFLDLGFAPPSNAYLKAEDLTAPELYFPLKLYVCHNCWLVQTLDYNRADELFRKDYAYFSSVSQTWLDHAARYVEAITQKLSLGPDSFVIEIASNDGYLLKNFVARKVPCLGIEPTNSTAEAAEKIGVPVLSEFFGLGLAERLRDSGKQADLLIGNNVYAHVPDINDFTAGMKRALKPGGTITLEFPHLMRLIEDNQFDTVYHEHYSYLSLYTVSLIFAAYGLRVFDVEKLPTHGGSLRIYGCHAEEDRRTTEAVGRLLKEEELQGLRGPEVYRDFQNRADRLKDELLAFLIDWKKQGNTIAAYGAAAKGNTLLNYAGVKPDLIPYVCDAAPSKQGKFLPGSHIPILSPSALRERRPHILLILPWNIADEIMNQHAYVRDWGGMFMSAVPEMEILP